MAKNLQSVLNSVVNELLQEGLTDQVKGAMIANGMAPGLAAQKASQDIADAANRYANAARLNNATGDVSEKIGKVVGTWGDTLVPAPEAEKIDAPEIPSAGLMGPAGASASDNVAAAMRDQSYLERAKAMAGQAGDWMYDNRYPLAGGLGAALAAGAGALYLRKKQREANKAAGR